MLRVALCAIFVAAAAMVHAADSEPAKDKPTAKEWLSAVGSSASRRISSSVYVSRSSEIEPAACPISALVVVRTGPFGAWTFTWMCRVRPG